jgi:AcrR family transcriptional regulator
VPYRATPRTEARRAATHEQILAAAHELIAHGGYREAQVAAVAERAGVATGSVYRHFGSKAELFAEAFRRASRREVDAVVAATVRAGGVVDAVVGATFQPGPGAPATTRIAAAVETFARRALAGRRLAWALIAEPVDPAVEAERLIFRAAYRDAFAAVLREGVAARELPAQDPELAAAALVGAIAEALVGPTSPTAARGTDEDALVAGLVRFCLRSVTEEEIDELHHA